MRSLSQLREELDWIDERLKVVDKGKHQWQRDETNKLLARRRNILLNINRAIQNEN